MWKRAVFSSFLVGLLVAFPVAFIAPASTESSPGIEWDKVKDLPHSQAIDLIQSRATEVRGTESFRRNIQDPWFWQAFVAAWLALATMCFAACALTLARRRLP